MTTKYIFSNNASTTLAESVSATATVLNLASGKGSLFPSPTTDEAFPITLVDASTGLTNEICYCTARSGDQLTVTRGEEGTTAIAWSAGDTAANYITAGTINAWLQASDLDGYATETWVDNQDYAVLNQPANFKSLSTTDTLALSDNGNNIPSTYWVKAQGYALSSDIPSLSGYATEEWVQDQNYTTLSAVANVGYVTGTTTTNVGVTNLQAVNYTGTDNTAAYVQVATNAGTIGLPTNANVAGQISSYAQPKGSYVTTDNYSSDFDSSDSRIQFFAYGKMMIFENIGTVSDGARVTFPRAFSGTPVVIGVPYDNADINGHPYSPDSEGFYVHKNGGGTINFTYIAIGPK